MAEYRKGLPKATPETAPFWEACKRHELMIQRCNDCQKYYFYPRPLCPHCLSRKVEWVRVSGRAKLHTYVINHRPAPGFEDEAPYIIAVVELEEGARMMTNIIGIEPDPQKLRIDMPLEVAFDDVTEEVTLPKFRPAQRGGG